MENKIRIAVDAVGGDHAPAEVVKGAVEAVKRYPDIQVILVGPGELIEEELKKYEYPEEQMVLQPASEIISTEEAPVAAIRDKQDSSIVVASKMVKEKKADAFVSAGSTGAVLTAGTLIVGRVKGVERPPLATPIPTEKGMSLLLDCGANVDAKPSQLVQFAQMGSLYMENVMGVKNPGVAILNIGVEEEKGNALTKATYPLLKECRNIRFVGNIEAREIPAGGADIVLCEAFAGNIVLKLYEGVSRTLLSVVKKGLLTSLRSKLGALMIKPALKETLKSFDSSEYGGAPLLGLNGLVVKTHGSAKAKEITNTILQSRTFVLKGTNEKIKECFAGIERVRSTK
ncbi:MAG: phosphate acyltransferase PlsX [Lachnospiraceae bacterium]|nr:phosphate acyltransferase PlsX [Lachnospiraceae bacterium]